MNIRILPISIISALCLSSCSSSQQDAPFAPAPTPEPSETSISFGGNSGSWQDAPSSRANDNGLENLFKSFRVWSYKTTNSASQLVMDGYCVKYTENTAGTTASNSADWEYIGVSNPNYITQTIKYWDFSASDYRFFAFSPSDARGVEIDKDDKDDKAKSFSIPYEYNENATTTDVPYVSDLWYSEKNTSDGTGSGTTTSQYGKCVTLSFAPLIAKVRFKFSYPDGSDGITIHDIRFRDSRYIDNEASAKTPLRGDITVAYPTSGTPTATTYANGSTRYLPTYSWTTKTGDADATGSLVFTTPYEEETDAIHILPEGAPYKKWYFVPPIDIMNDFEQGSYTITATIDGNNTSATVPAAYMQWKVGFQYTYIFKITQANTGITFADLQVEEWLPGDNIDNNGSGTGGW